MLTHEDVDSFIATKLFSVRAECNAINAPERGAVVNRKLDQRPGVQSIVHKSETQALAMIRIKVGGEDRHIELTLDGFHECRSRFLLAVRRLLRILDLPT